MLKLTGKQKRFLRSEAHHFSPMFQIGKNNLSKEIVDEYVAALSKRELIKVQILQNATINTKEAVEFIQEHSDITVVQIIGHVLVLYLPAEEEKYRRYSDRFPMTGH